MPSSSNITAKQHIQNLLPFWVFILLFKSAAVLHYSLIGVFGLQVLPLWAVGLATGGTTFLQLICDIPAGKLIDRYGARFTLFFSTAFFLAAIVPLFFGLTPLTYFLTLLFSGIGWLFFTPSIGAYILAVTPEKIMGKTTGIQQTAEGIGGILATIGIASILSMSVPSIALILSYPMIGAGIILWFIWKPKQYVMRSAWHHNRANAALTHHRTLLRIFRSMTPAAPLLLAWSFAISFYYGIIWLVLPVSIATGLLDIPGYSLSVFESSMLITGFAIGNLVDKVKNRARLILIGLFACIIILTFLSSTTAGMFAVFAFLFSISDELITVSLWSWLEKLDQRHDEDGVVAGTITLADDLGWTLGPVAGSILLANLGPNVALITAGAPITALFIIFSYWYLRNRNKKIHR